ncbi:GA module-containing protein, partial [Staphylococcus sp. GSSP0090]|nr:GA module-containing protein [Staphylococcus sp. GSSP0090]
DGNATTEEVTTATEALNAAMEAKETQDAADAKAIAKEEVESLDNLTDKAKTDYKDQIDKAKSQAEIDGIVQIAKNENQVTSHGESPSSYNHHSNKPSVNIDDNHQDKDTVNHGSENTTGITIDHASMEKAQEEAKQFINHLPKLSEQQQGHFNQRIENAETVQQIQDIVDEANVVNNDLPDTGIDDNQPTTIFGSAIALLAGLFLLRRRKDKKNE